MSFARCLTAPCSLPPSAGTAAQYEKLWRETFSVTGDLGDVPSDTAGLVIPKQPERTIVAIRIIGAGDEIEVNDTFSCKVRVVR